MDAGRLRRETGSLCHSFHGLTRVMAVAVQGFQAYFDVLILALNIIAYGEDRRDLCTLPDYTTNRPTNSDIFE